MSNISRTDFVTGAGKGIGLAIARRLGRTGLRVVLGARSPERGELATAALRTEGIDATFVQIDLGAPETIPRERNFANRSLACSTS